MSFFSSNFVSIFVVLFFSHTCLGEILLPIPKGEYVVGYSTAKLVDESRTDPYDPNHGKRNVMISLFYPIERSACEATCAIDYMPATSAAFLGANATVNFLVPNGTYEKVRLQVCCKTSPSETKDVARFPLVLFSPGLTGSRLQYGARMQTLASAGYAVVSMDHTYDTIIVEYPDGTYTLGEQLSYWNYNDTKSATAYIDTRVEDAQFVLSQLELAEVTKSLVPGASGTFDTRRPAFFGHSFGGATAIRGIMKDERFVGAINLDGGQFGTISDADRPGLIFGRGKPSPHTRSDDATWADTWDHLKGWKRELALAGSEHITFMDETLIFKVGHLNVTDAVKTLLGTLDGARSFEIISVYIQAFMDFVVKGKNSSLFEGPSDKYPEMQLV